MPPSPRAPAVVLLTLLTGAALGCSTSYPRLSFAVQERLLRETTLDDMPEGAALAGVEDDAVVRLVRTGKSSGACSGALIGPRHVLTAQHCVVHLDALRELTRKELSPSELHVELGGGYLPWGRVGVREVHTCPGYEQEVDRDVAVVILSKPVPAAVHIFEIAYDVPREAGVFELVGFGTDTKPREIPLTGWYVSSVTRHMHRGSVMQVTDGALVVGLPGSPGDSGGPIVDVATGRIAGVVSKGRSWREEKDKDGAEPRVGGARLLGCKSTILAALTR